MNMRKFVESLSVDEMNEFSSLIHDRRKQIMTDNSKPLNEAEKDMLQRNMLIDAIKSYRTRNQCSLMETKIAIDIYRGR